MRVLKEFVEMLDPSELLRPEAEFADKSLSKFRDYSIDENDPLKERVRRTYREMHLNQTVDFVRGKNGLNFSFVVNNASYGNSI